MDQWVFLLFVLVLAGMVIIALALILNQRLRARIYLPGRAEFFIDTRRGWSKVPKQPSSRRPSAQKKEKSRQRRTWLAAKVRGGPDWEYELGDKAQVYIGRHPDNDIVLRDKSADARHAVIYFQDGRYRTTTSRPKGQR